MEPVFSDRDVIYVQTVHYVHTLCIQNKRWSAAALYGETILPAFRSVPPARRTNVNIFHLGCKYFQYQALLRAQHGCGGGPAGQVGPGHGGDREHGEVTTSLQWGGQNIQSGSWCSSSFLYWSKNLWFSNLAPSTDVIITIMELWPLAHHKRFFTTH